MSEAFEKNLLELIEEFWTYNWEHIHPPGSPEPSSNQGNFADFSNWLSQRLSKTDNQAEGSQNASGDPKRKANT